MSMNVILLREKLDVDKNILVPLRKKKKKEVLSDCLNLNHEDEKKEKENEDDED